MNVGEVSTVDRQGVAARLQAVLGRMPRLRSSDYYVGKLARALGTTRETFAKLLDGTAPENAYQRMLPWLAKLEVGTR